MNQDQSRYFFLDWVRIIAFFILIFYHVGMYYVTWDWHVKSPHASDAIEPLMMLSSPWRLGLLFMISGVASAFMLRKISALRFMRQRSVRLLVPLIFGMLVIVPPQPYFEIIEKIAYQGSYLDFMRLYITGYHGFCKDHSCLDLPTWNHLWFVAYLWVYTLVLGGLMLAFGRHIETLSARLGKLLGGWNIIVLPAALLALVRVALVARYPATHGLVDDWFNHANYGVLFLLGVLLANQRACWAQMEQLRFASLGIALTCWASLIIYFSLAEAMAPVDPSMPVRITMRVVYALCQWTAITAVCGFAHRHLQFDSAKRRYLTEAVFPVYIVHQSLIVAMAHLIKPAKIAAPIEGLLLVTLTLTISLGVFEVVRRVRVLRPLFGLAGGSSPAPRMVPAPAMETRAA